MRREWEVFDILSIHLSFFRGLSIILQSYFVEWLLKPAISLARNWSLINNSRSYHWSYLTVRCSYLQSDGCSITVCIMKYNFIWVKCSHVRLQNYVHSRICCKRSQPRYFGGKPTFCIYCTAVKPISATIDII
jgi:hypothetical protein